MSFMLISSVFDSSHRLFFSLAQVALVGNAVPSKCATLLWAKWKSLWATECGAVVDPSGLGDTIMLRYCSSEIAVVEWAWLP